MNNIRLSVIIIAKNAQDVIVDAIKSVSFADEIIVVDNESIDKTKAISEKHKAIVVTCKTASFADLRTFGLQKAKGDWIFYIDADERVTEELASSITEQVSRIERTYDAFFVRRKNFYLGKHEWPSIEKIERLFRRDGLVGWKGELHESPLVTGKMGELDGYLLHYTHRDLSSMLEKTIVWSKTEAMLRLKADHPMMSQWRFFRVMLTAFIDSYIKHGGFRIGTAGLVESLYQSFSMFITYARLWEMQQKEKK